MPVLSLPSFTGNRNNIDIFLYNWRALLHTSSIHPWANSPQTLVKRVLVLLGWEVTSCPYRDALPGGVGAAGEQRGCRWNCCWGAARPRRARRRRGPVLVGRGVARQVDRRDVATLRDHPQCRHRRALHTSSTDSSSGGGSSGSIDRGYFTRYVTHTAVA